MSLLLLGLNHRPVPVQVRERLAVLSGRLPAQLAALHAVPGVREVAIVSTCNRFEIYAVVDDPTAARQALLDALEACDLSCYLYAYGDGEAATHACQVAAGLDSFKLLFHSTHAIKAATGRLEGGA